MESRLKNRVLFVRRYRSIITQILIWNSARFLARVAPHCATVLVRGSSAHYLASSQCHQDWLHRSSQAITYPSSIIARRHSAVHIPSSLMRIFDPSDLRTKASCLPGWLSRWGLVQRSTSIASWTAVSTITRRRVVFACECRWVGVIGEKGGLQSALKHNCAVMGWFVFFSFIFKLLINHT